MEIVSYVAKVAIIFVRMSSLLEYGPTMEQFKGSRSNQLSGCTSKYCASFIHIALRANNYRLPDSVSFAEGALLEPLSVVMHGINTAGLSLGRGALICGAGPIGLIALAAARASGAHPIVITDLEPRRLAFAQEFVPSCKTYMVNPSLDAAGNAKAVRALFGNEEYFAPSTVLECTGVESSVCTAAYAVRRGGTVMVIGVGKSIMNNLPFMHISLAEVRSYSTKKKK